MQRRFRLQRAADFERSRREGRAFQHRMMMASVTANGLDHNRYGFVVGRQLGKAVVRNRLRRRLREAVRGLHPQLQSGFDIVIVARRPLVGQPFDVVRRIVSEVLHQAGIVESS